MSIQLPVKRNRGVSLVLTLLLFFLSHTGYTGMVTGNVEKLPVFRVGYLPVLAQLPLVISYDRDRYAYSHVRIELTKFTSYIALEAAFRVHAIDIAYLPVPTILKMKADGVDILIGDTLHRGGISLVAGAGYKEDSGGVLLLGAPGLGGNAQLLLDDYFAGSGGDNGRKFKIISVQLSDGVAAIERGQIDGILFPEPYPTGALMQVEGVERIFCDTGQRSYAPLSALAFSRKKMSENTKGLSEWLASIEKSCALLEEDIHKYKGAQTVISQQGYFGFNMELVREALEHKGATLTFGVERIKNSVLKNVVERMISEKLLLHSLDLDEALLRTYF